MCRSYKMTVTVTDFKDSLRREKDFDHVIGLLDHGEQFSHLALKLAEIPNRTMFWFDDVPDDRFGHAPKEEHIAAIIKLIKDKGLDDGSKNVLVHCAAGISRSTATAIGLLIMRGLPIESAFEIIERQRPFMWPNKLVLAHFDLLLGLNWKLTEFHRQWEDQGLDKHSKKAQDFAALFGGFVEDMGQTTNK